MAQKQRLEGIREFLYTHKELSVDEACGLFSASPATIRRDFNKLIETNEAVRTWGGIVANGIVRNEQTMSPTSLRETLFVEEKRKIAEAAAGYVREGDVVIIDGGTTTFFMSPHLADLNIRVITNSILIAHQIDKDRRNKYGAEVFVTGGLIYPESGLLVGPRSVANIREYHANWAFLSVGGIDTKFATNSNQLVVETERAIIGQSEKVVMLADHSKFGKTSMCKMCAIDEIDILITDSFAESEKIVSTIRANGVEVVGVATST